MDNAMTLSYIKKQGGTKSQTLNALVTRLFALMDSLRLDLVCRHIPGGQNILADQLSRAGQKIPTEWTLHQEVLQTLWSQ